MKSATIQDAIGFIIAILIVTICVLVVASKAQPQQPYPIIDHKDVLRETYKTCTTCEIPKEVLIRPEQFVLYLRHQGTPNWLEICYVNASTYEARLVETPYRCEGNDETEQPAH